MLRAPDSVRRYTSVKERLFKPAVMNFFATECPKLFGPLMREKMAEELIRLFDSIAPEITRVKPGQIVWNALDKNTRADSPRRRYVPVVLTVVAEEDIDLLTQGVLSSKVAEQAIARMIREAYEQGGILSSRDVALMRVRPHQWASKRRRGYEQDKDCTLPHTGALHDMGSTVSHKAIIVRKVVIEKKDPADVAKECNHCQAAVDRYLKDYHRVKTLYEIDQSVDFIHLATEIARHVVMQYIALIEEEKKTC